MAKQKTQYTCNECGSSYPMWYGRCPNCQSWNTLVEETPIPKSKGRQSGATLSASPLCDVSVAGEPRTTTGIDELDRVLGGGIVKGSAVLIGGEPGAGKSTLLLQVCGNTSGKTLYFSGEESVRQIKLRSDRLGTESDGIYVSNETDVERICSEIASFKPALAVIDSIQTMKYAEIDSAAGTVSQIRVCTALLLDCAKSNDIPVFIVGHVNKDGAIAGPKIIEHIVDTVLYFEGERSASYRILRAAKNRFGSTNEIGVFEMTERGLSSVQNPSAMLLEGRNPEISGSAVTCVVEGSRPLLCEVQVLASKTTFATGRRTASGFDYNRANLLLAVLEKRAGISFSALDVYVNIAGGINVDLPCVDLAVAAAAVSSVFDKPLPTGAVFVGEIGLGGEVRSVPNVLSCIAEAERLGCEAVFLPETNRKSLENAKTTVELKYVKLVTDMIKLIGCK